MSGRRFGIRPSPGTPPRGTTRSALERHLWNLTYASTYDEAPPTIALRGTLVRCCLEIAEDLLLDERTASQGPLAARYLARGGIHLAALASIAAGEGPDSFLAARELMRNGHEWLTAWKEARPHMWRPWEQAFRQARSAASVVAREAMASHEAAWDDKSEVARLHAWESACKAFDAARKAFAEADPTSREACLLVLERALVVLLQYRVSLVPFHRDRALEAVHEASRLAREHPRLVPFETWDGLRGSLRISANRAARALGQPLPFPETSP